MRNQRESLGLPVRSIRSRIRNQDSLKLALEMSPVQFQQSSNKTFGDLGAMNLEHTFNESAAAAAALSSPIPWR